MIKFIKKILANIIHWAQYNDGDKLVHSTRNRFDSIGDDIKSLNFTIYNAAGGKIVKTSYYDMVKDRTISNLYIINEQDDFGNEIAQIITRENLSR